MKKSVIDKKNPLWEWKKHKSGEIGFLKTSIWKKLIELQTGEKI